MFDLRDGGPVSFRALVQSARMGVGVRAMVGSEPASVEGLWAELYPDLKNMARSRLRHSGHHTLLDTTGLVNEAYLRVAGGAGLRSASPAQFLAYAARTMRSVVVDLVRERQAQKRGGQAPHVTLNTAVIEGVADGSDEPLRVDEALHVLAKLEPRLCQVVEMRYFAGFTETEIAEALGVTDRTVRRDWSKACLLLRSLLQE